MVARKPFLVTAFKPWNGRPSNITKDVVEALSHSLAQMGADIKVLDVSYDAVDSFVSALDISNYERIISLGIMRQSAPPIRFETLARKTLYKPDDLGMTPSFNYSAADYYQSSDALLSAKQNLRLYPYDMALSANAGAYLCEYTLYKMLEKTAGTDTDATFIHFSNDDLEGKKSFLMDYLDVLSC